MTDLGVCDRSIALNYSDSFFGSQGREEKRLRRFMDAVDPNTPDVSYLSTENLEKRNRLAS
jgi:hypothetical protein